MRSFKFIQPLKNFSVKKSMSENVKNNIQSLYKNFDPSQVKTLDEKLILVDEYDNDVSFTTKIDAHLKSKKNAYPHRAFSVFLFNKDNKLLLQKRSSKKITFPDLWSNSCCSHPLNNTSEMEKKENLGIRTAAIRRMKFELGLDTTANDYFPFERILYRADSDATFEEYELDYLILAKLDFPIEQLKKLTNPDEVSDIKYVSKEELLEEVSQGKIKITPWFKLLVQNRIDQIYANAKTDNLKQIGELKIIRYI